MFRRLCAIVKDVDGISRDACDVWLPGALQTARRQWWLHFTHLLFGYGVTLNPMIAKLSPQPRRCKVPASTVLEANTPRPKSEILNPKQNPTRDSVHRGTWRQAGQSHLPAGRS